MTELLDLAVKHQWVAFASVLIGVLVRLGKSDTTVPVDIPPRWRVWIALGLGLLSGVLQRAATGVPWGQAIAGGFAAFAVATVGHQVVIGSIRGGREFVVPGMTLPGVAPGPNKPSSLPPPGMPVADPSAPAAVIIDADDVSKTIPVDKPPTP